MTATLSANGHIEIPSVFRVADSVRDGQTCDIERVGRGEYRLKFRDDQPAVSPGSWLDILLSCPAKDWYVPQKNSATTDELKPSCFG